MPRRRAWSQAEVICLLSLVQDSGEAALLMASSSRPNEALWREISQGLASAGYERSVSQCRAKWKALKQAFHSERETRQRALRRSPPSFPYYRPMKRIWEGAGRPAFGERRLPETLLFRKCRLAPATFSSSSSESPEHDVHKNTPAFLRCPLLKCEKDEPEGSGGEDNVVGLPPTGPTMPHTNCYFSPVNLRGGRADLKQEGTEGEAAAVAGATTLGMGRGKRMLPVGATVPGSNGTAAMSEQQPAADEDASDTSLHGPDVGGLLQNIQQLLVQILQTSRQQQMLLESLASDTLSKLSLLSHSLIQVGETLQQLLLQPQIHSSILGHYAVHVPLFEGDSRVPCYSGIPHISPDHKEEPQLSAAAEYTPL